MWTLLLALGIIAVFGALFWLDRYYKGPEDERTEDEPEPDPDGGGDNP